MPRINDNKSFYICEWAYKWQWDAGYNNSLKVIMIQDIK